MTEMRAARIFGGCARELNERESEALRAKEREEILEAIQSLLTTYRHSASQTMANDARRDVGRWLQRAFMWQPAGTGLAPEEVSMLTRAAATLEGMGFQMLAAEVDQLLQRWGKP